MFTRTVWLTPTFLLSVLSAQVSNVDWATQVHPILQVGQAGCAATGSCHGSGQAGLTITADAATTYTNIVNKASSCASLDYIEPDDPSASHLYKKIEGTQACGGRMPANNTSYFIDQADQLEIIRVWIEEGALAEAAALAVDEKPRTVPQTFALEPNFPNPFNPATTIGYRLPQASRVQLSVYDLLGQEVAVLVNTDQLAGSYQVVWSGRNDRGEPVPAGVYFYRLEADAYAGVKKMVFLK